MPDTSCCFKGRGKVWFRKQVDFCPVLPGTPNPNPWYHIGNAELFQINTTTTEQTVKDFTSKAGGIACSSIEIDQVNLNVTMDCFKKRNILLALLAEGAIDNVPAGAVANEVFVVEEEGEFIPLEFIPTGASVVVTGTAGAPVYVLGTDYEVTGTGVQLITVADGGSITVGTDLEIDYNYPLQTQLDIIQSAAQEYEVYLDGFNIAEAGAPPFGVHLFRVRFSPAQNIDFISEDFITLEVTGKVMQDECHINASGFEQYGLIKLL